MPTSPGLPRELRRRRCRRQWGDEHRRSATRGLLGTPSRRKGGFSILQLLLGGRGRLLGLRLLQTVRLLLVALLPCVSLRHLPEVGGGVNPRVLADVSADPMMEGTATLSRVRGALKKKGV